MGMGMGIGIGMIMGMGIGMGIGMGMGMRMGIGVKTDGYRERNVLIIGRIFENQFYSIEHRVWNIEYGT